MENTSIRVGRFGFGLGSSDYLCGLGVPTFPISGMEVLIPWWISARIR